jgi:hypothetical protein
MLDIRQINKALNVSDKFDKIMSDHESKRKILISESLSLQQTAADKIKEASSIPNVSHLVDELESSIAQSMANIKDDILAWAHSEQAAANDVVLGSMQAVDQFYSHCESYKQCLSVCGERGKYAVALIMAGTIENPVQHLIPEIDQAKPHHLYTLALSLGISETNVNDAKKQKKLLDKIEALTIPESLISEPVNDGGRYVRNLTVDDFSLVFGTDGTSMYKYFISCLNNDTVNQSIKDVKSAIDFKIWRMSHSKVL